jgi:hypothetical protein
MSVNLFTLVLGVVALVICLSLFVKWESMRRSRRT